jgi:hypothetical protein
MNIRMITAGAAAAAFLTAGFSARAQVVTSGLVLNLEAGNNPLHSNEWQDVSASSADVFLDSGDPPVRLESSDPDAHDGPAAVPPTLGEDGGVSFYSFSRTDPSVWGTSENPPVSSNPGVEIAENFSMELWLRANATQNGGEHQIASLRSFNHTIRFGLGLATAGGGVYAGRTNNIVMAELRGKGTATSANSFDTGVQLPVDGVFHHLVMVVSNGGNPATANLHMYYDNGPALNLTAQADFAGTGNFFTPTTIEWATVGNNFNLEYTRNFQGDVSAFRVYDIALSTAEVAQNFAAGPSRSMGPLVPSSLVAAPGAASLSFEALPNVIYQVETVEDLVSGTWQAKPYTITGNGGLMWVTDADADYADHQNYRAVRQ